MHEGLPAGESIPWGAWLEPLGYWYGFFLLLSFMMICMGVILHRQWSQHERLAYPMTQLPLQMIEGGVGPLTRLAPIFKNKVMWLGFSLPFLLLSLNGLNHYFQPVPEMKYPFLTSIHFFRNSVYLPFALHFAWVGFFIWST